MTRYFIETSECAPEIAIYSNLGKLVEVEFPYESGRGAENITDHGNGWALRNTEGRLVEITYSDVANIVNAFIIFQREGHRIYQARIYRGSRVANIRSRRK